MFQINYDSFISRSKQQKPYETRQEWMDGLNLQVKKFAKQCKCCFCNLLKKQSNPFNLSRQFRFILNNPPPPFHLIVAAFFVSLCQLGALASLVKPHLEILCLTQNDVGQNGRELWPCTECAGGKCWEVLDMGLWVIHIKRVRLCVSL